MTLRRVARVETRLAPFRWEWAEREADRIAENWRRRVAARPQMFNGRVLMISALEHGADDVRARYFATDYANLTALTDWGFPDRSVRNGFAMGALVGSDGGWLLGRMGPHTANAGRLYFPCGTPDMDDLTPDATVDLAGSLVREIVEETGIPEGELAVDPEWTVVEDKGLVGFMRVVRLPIPAKAARDRILAHLATDPEPELADIRIVRSLGDLEGEDVPGTVPIFLANAFRRTAQR